MSLHLCHYETRQEIATRQLPDRNIPGYNNNVIADCRLRAKGEPWRCLISSPILKSSVQQGFLERELAQDLETVFTHHALLLKLDALPGFGVADIALDAEHHARLDYAVVA